jgi:histone acetyltransferase (RNA polymerase elongator complex component)
MPGRNCTMKKDDHLTAAVRRPLIIPIFIMNSGCPHRCIFCNQKITAGNYSPEITREFFDSEVLSYLNWNKDKFRGAEIAFYGGSFTGIERERQEKLLSWANFYLENGLADSIRISTRPDYISSDILSILKRYNVQTVEIGAQSFVDEVLQFARRGHNADATIKAIHLLKESGFKTGLHLMAGLPKDSPDGFIYSLDKTIGLKPDTVRIHPVVVFRGTALADEFKKGNYQPLHLSEAVNLCRLAWEKLTAAGISVIRTGLHWTKEMEDKNALLAGPMHPAFGHLVLSALFYDRVQKLLENIPDTTQEINFHLSPQDVSNFHGLNNSNISAIKKLYPRTVIKVITSKEQKRGSISLSTDRGLFLKTEISGIN